MAINFSWLRSVCFTLRFLISWIHFIHCLSVRRPAPHHHTYLCVSPILLKEKESSLSALRRQMEFYLRSRFKVSHLEFISLSFLLNFPLYLLAKLAASEFRSLLAGKFFGMEFNIFNKNMHIYLQDIRSMQFYLSHIRFALCTK